MRLVKKVLTQVKSDGDCNIDDVPYETGECKKKMMKKLYLLKR